MMQISNYDFLREGWASSPSWTLKRKLTAIFGSILFWLLGSVLAFYNVGSMLEYENQIARGIMAAAFGPMGYVWTFLEWTGFIVETDREPSRMWMVLFFLQIGLGYLVSIILSAPVSLERLQKRDERKQRQKQGQLTEEEAGKRLQLLGSGLPMAIVKSRQNSEEQVTVGKWNIHDGHMLVSGPTRSGKGLHLTKTLLTWSDAAIVVDPKGEQYKRTAGYRQKNFGPVYCVPGHTLPLSSLYDLTNPDDVKELHDQTMQPEQDSQRIFADKSLSLFEAIGHFAKARGVDPIRSLLRAANDDITVVLKALESVPAALPHVRKFTNGLPPEQFNTDRFVASAYGTLTTRFYSYKKHMDTIAPQTDINRIPLNWARTRATIYITYDLKDLKGAGGVVAAILAGLMRAKMADPYSRHTLVAIDELAAVKLRNMGTYLSTVGGYGITMLYYIQAFAQLEGIYGKAGAEEIISNSAHQVWYSPNDMATARRISDLYGTFNKPRYSYNHSQRMQTNGQNGASQNLSITTTTREEPMISPTEVMALPKDRVVVITERDQQYRFVGQRVNGLADLKGKEIPAPAVPKPVRAMRTVSVQTDADLPAPANEAGAADDAADGQNDSDASANGGSTLPRKPLR